MTKKRIFIFTGIALVIIIGLLSPKIYNYMDNKLYYSNHIVTYVSLAEFTVLDKYTEEDSYFLKISLDSEYFIEKYKIKDKVRTYKVDSKELYDKVNLSRSEDLLGLQIESVIPTDDILKEEIRTFRRDPIRVISKPEYSKFIKIIDVY